MNKKSFAKTTKKRYKNNEQNLFQKKQKKNICPYKFRTLSQKNTNKRVKLTFKVPLSLIKKPLICYAFITDFLIENYIT